jgi:hypothetical protein
MRLSGPHHSITAGRRSRAQAMDASSPPLCGLSKTTSIRHFQKTFTALTSFEALLGMNDM